ncbi:MAG: ZIP family metal transporter [Fusobacteriaceae bacterium]|nr:ZIP family metal transporter [Fusobacteriaceae bacterium]
MKSFLWTLGGTGFIFLMTSLGSAVVFFFRKEVNRGIQTIFLGFAAGIMIAASVFGLLIPAIEESANWGKYSFIPAALGFLLGVGFLLILDGIIPHLHPATNTREGPSSSMKRTTLLVSAVTIHNIPEGMAVGLSFALAAQHSGDASLYSSAIALALGVGIQNFPEGAAVSLPLRKEGFTAWKAFLIGCLSGVTEPLFGILVASLSGVIGPVMPWLLSFSAGAMLYVVVEELIPEAHLTEHTHAGTLSVMLGFVVMMILDVAL